ncbi:MAG: hypothetical protein V7637_2537 [Mycobacteriales bacterium]
MSTFTAVTFQNEYLPAGTGEVDAVVTVTAADDTDPALAPAGDRTEIILLDKSGSMGGGKITAAKGATTAAIDCIPDGTHFAVIAGDGSASVVVPLTEAAEASRRDARDRVGRIRAGGGTAMSTWLSAAAELFQQRPGVINHAILLTDGKNESEQRARLDAALADVTGLFQCDCRGVGTGWLVEELRHIAGTLLGTVDIVAEPDGLAADFTAMIGTAMGRNTPDVRLRVWTPAGATVTFVKQVAPQIGDVTGKRIEVSARVSDYPTGAWAAEARDYHIQVVVVPGQVSEEKLAARVSVVTVDADGAEQVAAQALVRAVWTDDVALSTRINRQVAHYTGQAELAQVIAEGLEARKAGDDRTATVKLGRAAQLAAASGNTATTDLLAKVVEIDDPATGTVRLRRRVEAADEMALDTRSTRTVRVGKQD